LSRFWREFRRRRVGKVTLAYLAGSWLLIEVTSQIFPALMLPEWASRLVVIVAIAGLPVVVIVAWSFDLTPRGVVRTPSLARPRTSHQQQPADLIGRESALLDLTATFESIQSGRGQFLGISGEAGMGKSTVTDTFLDRLHEVSCGCLVGSGRSSERHGEMSAFMPVIEALSGLVATDESGDVEREMAKCAPTWYGLVFPGHDNGDDVAGERAKSQGRMQHELAMLLSRICAKQPVVICLDDFHWADVSTLDALVYLADRLEGLKLLLIVSYRETELQQTGHPFVQARLGLKSRGAFRELKLEPWDLQQVQEVIESEFSDNRFPPELYSRIYDRTAGHPLFVVETIRYMKDSAAIRQEEDFWVLAANIDEVTEGLPGSVRSVIERNMGRIDEADRRLLSAASVQGYIFDSAVLARVLDSEAADIEERLDKLEHVYTLVKMLHEQDMPDGTVSSRYSFGHILYHDHFLTNLKPSRRVEWASATAHALSSFHEPHQREVAAELAHLFAAAREHEQAATHYLTAASNSASVFAYRESAAMASSGLEAISSAPPSAERERRELHLQLALGRSLCMTEGYGSHETMSCFEQWPTTIRRSTSCGACGWPTRTRAIAACRWT
jgi:predicted ATPase